MDENVLHGVEPWKGNLADEQAPKVLVLPGANYPAQLPGLALPLRALTLDGWNAHVARWTMGPSTAPEQAQELVDEAIAAFVDRHGLPDLLLAKSVGTRAAGWTAANRIPAIWTTPLLTVPDCVEALARSTAPALLVAGTDDRAWDAHAAVRTKLPVHLIDGPDHGWQCDDWRRELEVLAELTGAVVSFAGRLNP
ncbi:hypothetical protein AAEX63_03995 [Luteococcus sp. H138]|uniref:hypothetical protein n=1 Tax=unclassified Luteococcus TaxID=2639923 RepID=UPI00313AC42F